MLASDIPAVDEPDLTDVGVEVLIEDTTEFFSAKARLLASLIDLRFASFCKFPSRGPKYLFGEMSIDL